MAKYSFTVHSAIGPFKEDEPKEFDTPKEAREYAEALAERPYVYQNLEDGTGAVIPQEGIIAVSYYDEAKAEALRSRIDLLH